VQDLAIEPARGHPISGAHTRYLEQPMPDIVISNEGPVRKIRMNRPEKKNALTLAMYETMAAAIEDAGTQTSVRCLLLAGAPDVFCAGNDLNDFVAMARSGALGASIVRFLHVLARCEKPLVAAVSGAAVGIGTTMLLHCDQVIASDNAVLLTPFVARPAAGSRLQPDRTSAHGPRAGILFAGDGEASVRDRRQGGGLRQCSRARR